MAADWANPHWEATFDALLADWARLKGVTLETARIHWPTDRPPIHRPPVSMEAPR